MGKNVKHIFGAYLNMARHNAFITLSYISKILGAETEGSESGLSQMKAITILNTHSRPEEKTKAILLLNKHFPFLMPMVDNYLSNVNLIEKKVTPEVYYKILTTVFTILNLLRDEYSHYAFVDNRLQDTEITNQNKQLVYYLKNCFDGGRRIVKDRFSFSENEMIFITDNRYNKVKQIDEQTGKVKNAFKEKEDFLYKLDNSDKVLSAKGICFFICLFIEKKYATIFLDNPEFLFFPENTKENQKKIIREIFSVYRLRLPKSRIDSTKPGLALGLEMLNELKKCPDELFQTLNKENKDKFRIAQNDGDDLEIENTEVLLKRYDNRFPYFAMRYIDDNRLFKDIRFQVSLGKYRYKFYEKKGIDGEEDRVRGLEKELNGFGRLNEIEEERIKLWGKIIRPFENYKKDTAAEEPYITDKRATYIVNGNRIGLAFRETLRKDLFLPIINGKETKCEKPDCWLSIHEFPAMIFHNLLCENEQKLDTEKIILNYVKRYKNFFSDINAGVLTPKQIQEQDLINELKSNYDLDKNIIPQKLWDYLSGKEIDESKKFEQSANDQINRMIAHTKIQLRKFQRDKLLIGSKENKIGKESYIEIKSGRLARFLSNDILKFQPTKNEGKDKLTGMNFQIMQSSLAIYDKSIDELRRLFVSAKLINSAIEHPFLNKVLDENPMDTQGFYETYLKKKIEYLMLCEEKSIKKHSYKSYPFLHPTRLKWGKRTGDYYKDLAHRYFTQPIELPRGLFTDSIKKKLCDLLKEYIGEIMQPENECNVSYLISSYFNHIYKDNNQEFYNYRRTYDFFNKLQQEENIVQRGLKERYYTIDDYKNLLKNLNFKEEIDNYAKKEASLKDFNSYKEKKEAVILTFRKKDFENDRYITGKYENILIDEVSGKKISENDINEIILYWDKVRISRIMQSLFNDYKKNEKLIRQYKIQDILLFLMAKEILIENESKGIEIEEIKQFKLKNLNLEEDNNILSLQIPFSVTLKLKDGSSKTIRQKSLKLKNYGDFFKFIFDQRIKTLLPRVKDAEVDRKELEKELEEYDMNRVVIFKLIFEFEKSLLSRDPEAMNRSYSFSEILNIFSENQGNKEYMRLIRNAFCHNNYPEIEKMKEFTNEKIPGIANSITNLFDSLTKENSGE